MKTFTPLLIFFLLTLVAHAQSPDPAAILAESTERAAAIRSMTCGIRYVVNQPGGRVEEHMLSVVLHRDGSDTLFGGPFLISDTTFNVDYIWNEGHATVIEHNTRAISIDTSGRGVLLGNGILGRLIGDFPLGRRPYASFLENGAILSHESVSTLEGGTDVIRLDFPEDEIYSGYTMRFWIARVDGLPRKFTATPIDTTRTGLTVEWSDINISENAGNTATYAASIEAGYTLTYFDPPPPAVLLPIGSVAPDWRLPTPGGDSISLSSLRGQTVVLDFWATWCGPCLRAMPHVQKLHEKYAGKKVKVIGVHCFERGDSDPAGMMREKNLTYSLVVNGSKVARDYLVRNIPSLYVIAPDGTIAFTDVGFNKRKIAEAEKVIVKLMAK